MSSPREWAAPAPPVLAGSALLERAVSYTRTSLQLVASTSPHAVTPCARWDLLALLRHMDDSLAAFTDAADIGYVDLVPVHQQDNVRRLVDSLKSRACALLAAFAQPLLAAWMGPQFAVSAGPVAAIIAVGLFANCCAQAPFAWIQAAGRSVPGQAWPTRGSPGRTAGAASPSAADT